MEHAVHRRGYAWRSAWTIWISIVAAVVGVAGCFGPSVQTLEPTTVGIVAEVEPLPSLGRTVAYHLETGEVLEIDLASANILGGPGGPGEGNLLLAGTMASGQRWLLGLPPNPSVDARPGCFRLVDTGVEIDGSIEMSNGLRLQKAMDFDPGVVTDGRYAVERYAFCLNSRGEVTSYGI